MARWKSGIAASVRESTEVGRRSSFMHDFFINRSYTPANEEEVRELEDFSLITSAMVLLIHVAKADGFISLVEQRTILNDLVYQLEQRPNEYASLHGRFAADEKQLVENIYDCILEQYENDTLDIFKVIHDINTLYEHNPYKKYYLIRLCFHVVYVSRDADLAELKEIYNIANRLEVSSEKVKEIEKEMQGMVI